MRLEAGKVFLRNDLHPRPSGGVPFAYWVGVNETSALRVLIVEDEQCIRDILVELFDVEGTRVSSAGTLAAAKAVLAESAFDLIVTDIRLGGRRDGGLQVMAAAGFLSPEATVIALTAYPDDDNRCACQRLGATHFLEKPVRLEILAELAARTGVPTAMSPAVGREVMR